MGLSNRTRLYLQTEGITGPEDLSEFVGKDDWTPILDNCRRPPQLPGPTPNDPLVNQQAFHLPAKSLMRLKVAAQVVLFYDRTNRPLTAQNLTWVRLGNFKTEWESLKEQKAANDEGSLPVISNKLSISNFFEAYETYAGNFIGQSGCPLTWIYRQDIAVPGAAPPLAVDQPFSEEHGSVAAEMISRMSHTHALYRPDNATGYAQLVTATLGTQYASTIAPFKRAKDGRGALMALQAQFAGAAHWDREVKIMSDFMSNSRWTGTTAFSLHAFLAKHRASFHTLQRCAEHVQIELPNERTRVGYLLENIDCPDKDVTTALSHIRLDDSLTGMRSDFERSVAFLLPTDPVKKKKGVKRDAGRISSTAAEATGAGGGKDKSKKKARFKATTGSSGVEFRYYKPSEFTKLSREQRDELSEHRRLHGNYTGTWSGKESTGSGGGKKTFGRAQVAAMIKANETEKEKESTEKESMRTSLVEEFKSIISSLALPPEKRLQRAGAKVASSAVDDDKDAAERCAKALMEKFSTMGSKAPGKSG